MILSPSQETLVIKFHTPVLPTGAYESASFVSVETLALPGAAERYATISTIPGSFPVLTQACYNDGTTLDAGIKFLVGGNHASYVVRYCSLKPDTDYYFSIAYMNPNPFG